MPLPGPAAAAATRLQDFYNNAAYDAGTNAGGFGQGGHRVNFSPALSDVGLVGEAAADAADAAAASEAAAEASAESAYYYLGAAASNPTVMGDGEPLESGAAYYNTVTSRLRVYNGSSWGEITVYTPPKWSRKTADYEVLTDGEKILVDSASARVITALESPSEGDEFSVARKGSGSVTVLPNGSTFADDTDSPANSFVISTQGEVVTFVYLNSTWRAIKTGLVA
jgi:hypothetical protein